MYLLDEISLLVPSPFVPSRIVCLSVFVVHRLVVLYDALIFICVVFFFLLRICPHLYCPLLR